MRTQNDFMQKFQTLTFIIFSIYIFMNPVLGFSKTCTDDYIIAGKRKISLLADEPFEISENESILYVRRGTLILKFEDPIHLIENEIKIKRYHLFFLNEKYFFELTDSNENNIKLWSQYAGESFKRGFGGKCDFSRGVEAIE